MAKYQKQYDSWEEQQQRYKIFKENLKRAVLLNQQNPTAVFSVTKFSDLTPEASIILLLLRSTQFIWGAGISFSLSYEHHCERFPLGYDASTCTGRGPDGALHRCTILYDVLFSVE